MKRIQTDNLTIIDYGDNTGKLQIFNKYRSHYGWTPKELCTSLFALPLEKITYNYVQSEVDKVYSTFNYEEIDELLNKLNNETN
jgi:disulfide oxidoreductase YuzD